MIEFECPYCQVRMNASPEEVGKPERCPSCGYMIVVPVQPPDLPATSRTGAWQSPRAWWGSNKRAVLIVSPILVAGLVALYMFATYTSSLGQFPPRAEVEKMLAERGYLPGQGAYARREFEGRMFSSVHYRRAPGGAGNGVGGITLYWDDKDPAIIVGITSLVMNTDISLEPEEDANVSERDKWIRGGLRQTKEHTLLVWEIAEKLSSIKYDQADMNKSRAASRDGKGGYIYRKNGFSMKIGEGSSGTLDDGTPYYLAYMTLKSEIQD
jgi:hypothetical protein